jgi:hypothetical protein
VIRLAALFEIGLALRPIVLSIENVIRLFGWSGVAIGCVAIARKDIQLFLLWQLVANISGFCWNNYLQKKMSWDTLASLTVTIVAVITKDQFAAYAAMLVRSVSYQLVFEQVVRQRSSRRSISDL